MGRLAVWASAPAVISEAPVPQADVHVSACVREGVRECVIEGTEGRETERDGETQREGILRTKRHRWRGS